MGASIGRTAVLFCRCGSNIGQVVRVEDLSRPSGWPDADLVAEVPVLCSREGQAWLAGRVREEGIDRVVIAGCSPREHEHTFRKVLAEAGRDPWKLQMVNLREQGEWLGGEPGEATARARRLVAAALARVATHRNVPPREVEVSGDAVVVGGGAAGISAALTLARRGRKVLLVERSPVLGGVVNVLDEIFPGLECASCLVEPALDEVLHHPNVEVLTCAEVADVRGSHGDLTVRVAVRPRRVDPAACVGCDGCRGVCPVDLPGRDGLGTRRAVGLPYTACLPPVSVVDDACLHLQGGDCHACVEACPFGAIHLDDAPAERSIRCGAVILATGHEAPAPPDVPGLVSAYQLERMLHPGGPTCGKLLRPDGAPPRSVLLAPSSMASDDLWPDALAKLGRHLRLRFPEMAVAVAGALDGMPRYAGLARSLAGAGATLLPGTLDPDRVARDGDALAAPLEGGGLARADLVVLWESPRPSAGTADLARRLRIAVGPDGFLVDQATPFQPTLTRTAGIHVAGAAGGPRTVAQAIRDGVAAAGMVLSALDPSRRMVLEPLAAEVDTERCAACAVCGTVCPYGAVGLEEEIGASRVEPSFCHGCGSCAAACPSGAIQAPHFTRHQIAEEISGLLRTPHPPDARSITP